MDKEMFGKSLRNYIYKEGYTKKSFAKKLNISYEDLDLIILNKFDDCELHKKYTSQILNAINMDLTELTEKYYNEDVSRYKKSALKSDEYKGVLNLDEEQREILVDLVEDKISRLCSHKEWIKMQEGKEWRVLDLEDEIKKLEIIKAVISNMVTIK